MGKTKTNENLVSDCQVQTLRFAKLSWKAEAELSWKVDCSQSLSYIVPQEMWLSQSSWLDYLPRRRRQSYPRRQRQSYPGRQRQSYPGRRQEGDCLPLALLLRTPWNWCTPRSYADTGFPANPSHLQQHDATAVLEVVVI